MIVNADKLNVSVSHEDGSVEFSMPWKQILSIGVLRTAHLDLGGEWSRKLVIVPRLGTQEFREWYVWNESAEWDQWIQAFESFIPAFDPSLLDSVLADVDDDETDYCTLYSAESSAVSKGIKQNELEKWFDNEYFHRCKKAVSELDENDETFFHIYGLLGEVGNGGFEQYFSNISGDEWLDTKQSLKQIRAEPALADFEQACNLFPRGIPGKKQSTRQNQIKRMSQARLELMHDLDERIMETLEVTLTNLRQFLNGRSR